METAAAIALILTELFIYVALKISRKKSSASNKKPSFFQENESDVTLLLVFFGFNALAAIFIAVRAPFILARITTPIDWMSKGASFE